MKRLLCLLLTGLLILSAAACTAGRIPEASQQNPAQPEQMPESSIEVTASPEAEPEPTIEVTTSPETEPDPKAPVDPECEPTEEPIDLKPIENPPIQPGEPITPPIDLTDPVQPIYSPDGAKPEVNGYADFSNLLSAALLSGTENRNLSPISVYLALAMVTEGAAGDTQAELLNLLGCKDLAELRGVCGAMLAQFSIDEERSTLDIHNSLWMADEINGEPVTFKDAFLTALTDSYGSEANTVRFGTQSASQQIAAWITEHTRGKINISPEALDFDPSTLAVLINTIYLKDSWAETFDPERTEADTFYAYSGEMTVDYMHRFDKNSVVRQGDGWIAYRVYLARVGYVTFVLPDEGVELNKLLGSPEAIDKLLHRGIEKNFDVSLMIPKFSFQDKMELTRVLQSLGLNLSFTAAADFSGMSDLPASISSVIQESYIGVDENGVEAAAYTMISVKTTAFNPVELERIDFHLTRPFFYAIESRDGTVLFIGTVTNPGAGE